MADFSGKGGKVMVRLLNSITFLALVYTWWRAIQVYPELPPRIPIHFNLMGKADGWGGRWTIYLLPLIGTVIAGFWFTIFRLEPGAGKKKLTPEQQVPFSALLLAMILAFQFINHKIVENALGRAKGLGKAFLPVFLAIIFSLVAWMNWTGRK